MTKRAKTLTLLISQVVASAALLCISVFNLTVAWFNSNKDVDAEGMNIQCEGQTPITTISCYAIKYDGIHGASKTLIDDEEGVDIEMSEYDTIFTDRNVNTPLFFRIEVSDFAIDKDLNLSIPCRGLYKNNSGEIINNLSNVVCARFGSGLPDGNGGFTSDTYDFSTISSADLAVAYQGMKESIARFNEDSFIDIETKEKSDSINLALSYNDFYTTKKTIDGKEKDVLVAYIEFDYYVTNTANLVEDYISSYSGNASRIITNDLGTITISEAQ